MSVDNLIPRSWPPEQEMITGSDGCTLRTADGHEYLDASGGALAVSIGYGDEAVAEAVGEQARRLPFAHSGHFANEAAAALGGELAGVLPGSGDDAISRFMFVTGGTEAVELAVALAYRIQVARGQPSRHVVIGRHLSYHGSSIGTLAVGGRRHLRSLVAPLLPTMPHLPPPYPYRPEWYERLPGAVAGIPGLADALPRGLSRDELERARTDPATALEVAIEALGPDNVCAFVAEPIIGASAGAVVPDDDYWPRVREICDRHGVLWIADEVMTGMGRTGRWLAAEHWDVAPDLVALGKGLGSAYVPLAAVGIRGGDADALMERPPGFPIGYTFAQHPVACAAGRAVLRKLSEQQLPARAARVGDLLQDGLREALADSPYVGEIRGRGLLIGIELVRDRDTREPFEREVDATGRVLRAAHDEHGVLFYPAKGSADGTRGDAFIVGPPLVVSGEECDRIVEAAVGAISTLGDL